MKKKFFQTLFFATSTFCCVHLSSYASTPLTYNDPSYASIVRWLYSRSDAIEYKVQFPLSYGRDDVYWKELYKDPSYKKYSDQVNPNGAIAERVMIHNGLDIYDGAVWQIAVSLAASSRYNSITPTERNAYSTASVNYLDFTNLKNQLHDGFLSYRDYCDFNIEPPYRLERFCVSGYAKYGSTAANLLGGKNGDDDEKEPFSFGFKFISKNWQNIDPLTNNTYEWPEYESVTGEQAWASLIGPIQSAYALGATAYGSQWIKTPFSQSAINLASSSMYAFEAMIDPVTKGAFRNVEPPSGYTPEKLPQKYSISVENNFSLYSGLSIYKDALKLLPASTENTQMLARIEALLSDLRVFFQRHDVFHDTNNEFYFYSELESKPGSNPVSNPQFALDVQTWGLATILSDSNQTLRNALENKYGKDIFYKIFEYALSQAGYLNDSNQIIGVGYTTQKPGEKAYVMSGEWTFGTINAAIILANYYKDDIAKYDTLIAIVKAMRLGIDENIKSTDETMNTTGYYYANKRVSIPFGWNSNRLTSTASTGWAFFVNSCFNPFELGGGLSKYQDVCQHAEILK